MPEAPRDQLEAEETRLLLRLAAAAISQGLHGRRPDRRPPMDHPVLERRSGVFVTVMVDGALNGCIGTLSLEEPLGVAVPRLAWEAAFADPRLPRLTEADYLRAAIKISLLSRLQPRSVAGEQELLTLLRPGLDGLVIAAGSHQGTFLPVVWDMLPDAGTFVTELKAKAGLARWQWPPGTRAWTFTAVEFGAATAELASAAGDEDGD